MRVFDKQGRDQILGKEIARGGEGAVYPLAAKPSVVVKLYHREVLSRRGSPLHQKVEAMLAMRSRFDAAGLAWPAILVFDEQGTWLGYAMHRVSGVPLSKVAHPMLYRKHVPDLDRRHLVRMLDSAVLAIGRLHDAGVCLGDVNLNNFLYDHAAGTVNLIDCDSFQVKADGRIFPCPVIAPDMMPPEHHGLEMAQVMRTRESDLFSLAILIFRCFMLGRHPYDFVGGGTVVENLRRGHFPYGTGGAAPGRHGAIPAGPWYLIWSHLTFEVKTLLIRTLKEGAANPAARASAKEWTCALRKYLHGLDQGFHESALRPAQEKSAEFRLNTSGTAQGVSRQATVLSI